MDKKIYVIEQLREIQSKLVIKADKEKRKGNYEQMNKLLDTYFILEEEIKEL